VIPEHGGILAVGVVIDRRLAGHVPIVGIAVAGGGDFAAVQMNYGSHFGLVGLRPVNGVVDGQKMFDGELVRPLHQNSLPAAHVECGAGRG